MLLIVSTDWNIVHYADNIAGRGKITDQMENKLKAQYKPIYSEPTLCVEPGIVTDLFGKVLVWYLPSILHPHSQVCTNPITCLNILFRRC